jgi:mono/diheme cytochrome c family protein
MNRTMTAALLATLWTTAAPAMADTEAGHRLAQQWCSSCHQVDPAGPVRDFVPSFVSLANRADGSLAWVRLWLMDPHPPMVGLNLSRAQIDQIVAYLHSLQRPVASPAAH